MSELYFVLGIVVGGGLVFAIEAIEDWRLHRHNRRQSLQRGQDAD